MNRPTIRSWARHLGFGVALALVACGGGGGSDSSVMDRLPAAPSSLTAADLAVLVAEGDATSEAIGRAYQLARGIPEANMIQVAVDGRADALSADAVHSAGTGSDAVVNQRNVLFYFTGLTAVTQAATNSYLPGAVADHVTSSGGVLPDGNGQMPITDWLRAGAKGSYGTVEEPCNCAQKFPRASVLVDRYGRGDTLIEAHWKSVQWPGQGLFVGEPLARPWAR